MMNTQSIAGMTNLAMCFRVFLIIARYFHISIPGSNGSGSGGGFGSHNLQAQSTVVGGTCFTSPPFFSAHHPHPQGNTSPPTRTKRQAQHDLLSTFPPFIAKCPVPVFAIYKVSMTALGIFQFGYPKITYPLFLHLLVPLHLKYTALEQGRNAQPLEHRRPCIM